MAIKNEEVLMRKINRLNNHLAQLREKISNAKKEKRALESELRNLSNVFFQMPGWVVIIQNEVIILANETVAKDLGYEHDEVIGRNFIEFVHPDFVNSAQKIHQERLKGKIVPNEYEVYLVTKWGEKVCCEARISRIRFKNRRAFIVNMTPLEKRLRMEKEKCTEQKLEAIERMSNGVVREINQCISIVEHCAETLGQKPTEGENNELPDGVKRLRLWHRNLVEKLKYLADINRPVREETFRINTVIEQVAGVTRQNIEREEKAGNGPIKLRTFVRTESAIKGSFQQVRNALEFMLANAIEALPSGGEIYLTAEESEGSICIYIQDNGTGIRAEDQERIFDPFFTTKGKDRMGLGLSLADAIVRRHGGSIEVISHEGSGTTFLLRLPLALTGTKDKKIPPGKLIKDANILIISEEDTVHGLLCQILSHKGGRIIEAITHAQVEKFLRRKKTDVVIVNMDTRWVEPGSVLRKIDFYQKGVKTVFITSGSESEIEGLKEFEKGGKVFFIGKPLEMNRVIHLISRAIRAKEVQGNGE